ncbi:polymerase delta-interacting protein 3-like [Argiope bruennichi]|uniref:polymerase delta-interacting protein 3-like n=1 Tax=Argiope bruennichi TaxID=94029 RepID=UPI0024955B29|nr:polymerase delta-interacting protein 3-like [Argiope bruennichi]
MKNDARILINKKRWRNQITDTGRGGKVISRGTFDARKILNLKRSANIRPKKELIRGSNKMSASAIPFVKKSFSSIQEPKKHVELSRDGNIIITAKSKDNATGSKFSQRNFQPTKKQPMQWAPADIDMDNVEHIGIDDVLDMESLPPAFVSPNLTQNRIPIVSRGRTLAEEVLSMQNTMVADQVANASTPQSARVYVTNLCSSVSKQDVMELFGDVGVVKSADMPQIGTAIIEFYDLADATRACETYHNRLLDGQPMRCYLQPNASSQRVSVSQRLGGRVPGASPVHLPSSNPRSRYNPRDVRFTVKLA